MNRYRRSRPLRRSACRDPAAKQMVDIGTFPSARQACGGRATTPTAVLWQLVAGAGMQPLGGCQVAGVLLIPGRRHSCLGIEKSYHQQHSRLNCWTGIIECVFLHPFYRVARLSIRPVYHY